MKHRDCHNDRRNSGDGRKGMRLVRFRRAAKATRSGLRRYPRAILDSLRDPMAQRLRSRVGSAEPLPEFGHHPLAAVWLGHASVFLRYAGLNILADPVFAERIGFSLGPMRFGLQRHAPAPLREDELPPLDLILVSHAHFDHLDKPTLRRLASRRATVVTARRTARLIPSGFGSVVELDWGQEFRCRDLWVSAIRPAHWGARTALDRRRGYNSYVLRDSGERAGGVLVAGDTAMTDAFDKLDGLALAAMGIGSYEPWAHAHATPEEAWRMFRASRAERLLPIHHSTFPLSDEHIDEPMQRLLAAAGDESKRIIDAAPGELWVK